MTIKQMKKVGEHIKMHGMSEDIKAATYQEAKQMLQDGCFDIYYDDARKTLAEIYEETEEEAARFSDMEVWERYKHIIALMASHKKYL